MSEQQQASPEAQIESLKRQVQHYRARVREITDDYEAKLLNLKLQAEDVIAELQESLSNHTHDPEVVVDTSVTTDAEPNNESNSE